MPGASHEEARTSSTNRLAGPIVLPSHQLPERFYLGGRRISAFRGEACRTKREPEDWVASTTCCAGHDTLGLTRLPSTNTLLLDEIALDPIAWLGPSHVAKYGNDTKLLIKLLDAGQRLPIHAHPHGDWAKHHINRNHGKAEAWHILSPGQVYLGLIATVSEPTLLDLVYKQDIETMLSLMHKIDVDVGDTVYVPPGMLHAIGEGILLVEVQEPEDLSILLEWRDFELNGLTHGHLGLGFEKAITAITTTTLPPSTLSTLIKKSSASTTSTTSTCLVPQEALQYFRMHRFEHPTTLPACFQLIVVLTGEILATPLVTNIATLLKQGSTTLLNHSHGLVNVTTNQANRDKPKVAYLVIRPPL